jgi:phosphoesterase RecJ-like protein
MLTEADLFVMVDLESIDRLGSVAEHFRHHHPLMVIDHHVPYEMPGDIRIIDVTAPAACLILARLLREVGVRFTSEISTLLLAGIVTDSGSFRYRNTTPEALSMAAYLLEHGGNLNLISEEVYQRRPLASTMLLGYALEHMKLASGGQLAWTILPNSAFVSHNATDEDTEGFVNEILFTECVKIAAILREPKEGKVRVSIRSRAEIDVAKVARTFGGGGHKNAAGCTFEVSPEAAEALLIPELEKCLASS